MSEKPLLTFFQHLEELRLKILIALAAVAAATAASFFYADALLEILLGPIRAEINEVYFFSPADAFVIKIKTSLLSGFLISSPIVFSQFWLFISPGLHPHERRRMIPVAIVTSAFFVAGALFSFYAVLPQTLGFLIGQQTEFLKPMVSINEYFSFVSGMMLAFGMAFNLPVFILALASVGVIKSSSLNDCQRYAVVGILILSAVLTPGPDIASQLMLALPLILLFELSLLGVWLMEVFKSKKNRRVPT